MNDVERDSQKIMKELETAREHKKIYEDAKVEALAKLGGDKIMANKVKNPGAPQITPDLTCGDYAGKSDMKAMTDRCNAGAAEMVKTLHSRGSKKGKGVITRSGGGK